MFSLCCIKMSNSKSKSGNYDQYFTWDTINNVKCIVWKFPRDVKGDKRRSIKDKVANNHLDTVMLDVKKVKNVFAYTDAIFVSENVSKWLNRMVSLYSTRGLKQECVNLPGGIQYNWSDSEAGTPYITANIYDMKSKIMIQPGNREESNLLEWLNDFNLMKQADNVNNNAFKPASASSPTPTDATRTLSNSDCDAAMDSRSSARSPKLPDDRPPVIMPTSGKKGVADTGHNVSSGQSTSSTSTVNKENATGDIEKVIVNEFLCFTLCKMQYLPKDILSNLCTKFYDTQVIADGKKILFDTVKPSERHKLRRGDKKAQEDFNDVYKVLLELKDDLILFVAKDLTNIPTISLTDLDIGKVLREINDLKEHVCVLSQSQSDIMGLLNGATKADVSAPSNHATTQTEHDSNANINSGRQINVDAVEQDSVISDRSYETVSETDCSWSSQESVPETTRPVTYANIAAQPPTTSHPHNVVRQSTDGARRAASQTSHKGGYTKVSNAEKSDSKIVIGTGEGMGQLKAVPPREGKRSHTPPTTRRITGVFATRFQPRTSSHQVESHIKKHTGLKVWVQKLITRYDDYCSFYLKAHDRKVIDELLDSNLWAKGILVKPYME